MCTAINYKTKNFYFGRTLDYYESYGEKILVTPRNYEFNFRKLGVLGNHYAIIGMGILVGGVPLYYDAMNEKGLCMAGLNFPDNAFYYEEVTDKDNIAPFEFISWILGRCSNLTEVKVLLMNINIVNIAFNEKYQLSPLHWIISDADESITVECVRDGMKVYDNSVGVLTNNPTFDMQMHNLNNYMSLSPKQPENNFSHKLKLKNYSYGMGAMGLPGDLSSQSRFVRASFVKLNSVTCSSEEESVNQFFHILGAVSQQKGCNDVGNGKYEYTMYTSCCNTDKGIYYYTTYDNSCVNGVDMFKEDLDGNQVVEFELLKDTIMKMIN